MRRTGGNYYQLLCLIFVNYFTCPSCLRSKCRDFCHLLYSPFIFVINRSFLPFALFALFLCRIFPLISCEQILEPRMGQNWYVAWLDYLSKGFERGGPLIPILYFFNQQQYGKGRHRCLTELVGRKKLYYQFR